MICGKVNIIIVQGDSYQKKVKIEGIDNEMIEGVYFSSDKLKFSKKLTYSMVEEKYIFSLTPLETETFPAGKGDYDITIKFIDDKIKTISYRESFDVLPKINKVGEINDG